ncbi:DUF2163 domain-containing protein [Martelella alba]|uniref:DUF2163 domain-containing protein n=1 Tax=Martelella alba TaxID=2590451 RepID=A0A506UA25_9HYPH|nr:DUF2163 domain-containing protein [Martelella alba]TPW29439.1 DUF2163 domain-containing protein [Martelella alba]
MKTINADLANHLVNASTTICFCWRLKLGDGSVLGFTEHDRDLTFDGTTFLAASGFSASAMQSEGGLGADTSEVAGGFSSEAISEEDLAAGRYEGARVEYFVVNWQAPSAFQLLSVQEIGDVRREAGAFRAELRSLTHKLSQPKGRSFARRCDAKLGDQRCGVDASSTDYSASGTITQVLADNRLLLTLEQSFEDGFFAFGTMMFTSGALSGLSVDVEANRVFGSGVKFDLWLPLSVLPDIGTGVTVTAGCNKAFSTCKAKFANQINFRGFPHVPGADFAYSYVDGESLHDGSPLYS